MNKLLTLPFLALLVFPQSPAGSDSSQIVVEAQFLNRGDLPDEFQFPLLELDFAVLRLRLRNNGAQSFALLSQELQVRDPKGKILTRAVPTEITPKIMNSKAFRRTNRNIHGQAGYGYPYGHPGIYGAPYPPTAGPGTIPSGPKTISVNQAQQIRSILEQHEIKDIVLAPGESKEALLYLNSKKPASKLKGSVVSLGSEQRTQVN